ncbi:metal ABC transporter substrate-binding protein [Loktanella sp. TSTF-M6]|uniref:High-affinity zinc uptake system protein ZnuA n=1 Tax=Loktanella gaetbuli TaxID=2881335 RepID=A0ABS8BX10_9RHOB|nr:metal ABC transporter substrate-binding protein [Loktanella gaetbuli]MCB5200224.1 metal ABC transporter substrate-binding protein [Loktanella gaetbuli]
MNLTRRAVLALIMSTVALPVAAQDRPVVATDNYPLAYFAERLGGGGVDVLFTVPGDVDPSFWRPGIADITAIQAADVIALNGAGFSTWPTKASLPRSRTFDTTAGLSDRLIQTDTVTHSHGDDGEHSHEATANYVWLDFELAQQQAAAIAEAMTRQVPDLADAIASSRDDLMADLAALDAQGRAIGDMADLPPVVASHPRYQYLGAAYGLDISAVEWDANVDPTADQWAALEALVAQTGAQVFIWEAEPAPGSRARMAEIGLTDVVFPPLANRPAEGDFVSVMQASLTALSEAFKGL